MEGAASDHHVVMGGMDVGWSDVGELDRLLARWWATRIAAASSSRRARPPRRRRRPRRPGAGGRLVVESGRGRRGMARPIVADGVWAHLAGAAISSTTSRPCSTGSTARRSARDDHRARRRPRRRSSSAPTAGGPASPTTSPSRTSAAAPTAWPATSSGAASRRRASSSPTTGGSPPSTSPPPPPRSCSPTTSRSPSRRAVPDADELVRGRPARRGRRHRDHRLPQPVDRQRVQGQGADRRGGRRRRSCRSSRRRSRENGGAAIERRPLADAEAAGLVERFDPYPGYERFVRRTIDLDALKAADISVLVEPLYGAGAGWIPRLLAGGRIRVTEIHHERNPFFGGINPEPIRPNVDAALAQIAARRLRPRAAPRRRRRPGRRGRRARRVHPPAPGHRAADVPPRRAPRPAGAGRRERQQHVDGRAARRALRDRRSTRRRSGSSSSARR